MMPKVIVMKDVTFTYAGDEKPAIRDINFSVRKGEFIAIIGRSGAGKTTLTLLINGLVPHLKKGDLRGEVNAMGFNPVETGPLELSSFIGRVFEDPDSQLICMTVKEEVAFGPENFGLSHREIEERVREALDNVGLEGFERRTPWTLSGGEKQRVAIAAVLAMRSLIIVLDEPTAALDSKGTEEVFSVLHDLNKNHGITVVLTTQKVERIVHLADRIVVMHEGRIIKIGTPKEIFRNIDLVSSYGMRIPQVTELAHQLALKSKTSVGEYPLTLEDGSKYFSKLLTRG